MGIKENGSFHPIRNAEGSRQRKAITIPFKKIFNLISEVAKKMLATIHKENAEKLASHVNFCNIIGTTSRTPTNTPIKLAIMIFLIM